MKVRQKHDFFSHDRKIRSSHVTRRDGCAIPFKGHGGKTNNESRAVSPPLQKRNGGGQGREKKSPGEFKRLCGIFFVIFPLNKSAGRKAAKLHFIQLVWHQAPGQERKCTIKCDLLERQSRGCERKERKEWDQMEREEGEGKRTKQWNKSVLIQGKYCCD